MLNASIAGKLAVIFILCIGSDGHTQMSSTSSTPKPELLIETVPPPTYPPMALAAHVSGDVRVEVVVLPDGELKSIGVLSGASMLRQATIDKAKLTQFECEQCSQAGSTFDVVYRFELGEARSCEVEDHSYPRATKTGNMITITERPFSTCDPSSSMSEIKVRSIRCLFLWKCRREEIAY
jgi:TonB family protein